MLREHFRSRSAQRALPPRPRALLALWSSHALHDLDAEIAKLPADASAEDIQNQVFEVGKAHYGKENLRTWFQALYETLLGSSQGPRMGSFIALYGIDNSRQLIAEALASA